MLSRLAQKLSASRVKCRHFRLWFLQRCRIEVARQRVLEAMAMLKAPPLLPRSRLCLVSLEDTDSTDWRRIRYHQSLIFQPDLGQYPEGLEGKKLARV